MNPEQLGHLDRLLAADPQFHDPWLEREAEGPGELTSWRSNPEVVRWIGTQLCRPGMSTLEIGCGASTVAFALAGAHHQVVTLGPGEVRRVTDYCAREGISLDAVSFQVGPSHRVLPGLEPPAGGWDLVYIDGAHAFPHPQMDWFHTQEGLKPGGLVLVDDVQIRAVAILHEFLAAEENWELVGQVAQTSAFRKLGPEPPGDWLGQAFNTRPAPVSPPLRVLRALRWHLRHLRRRGRRD